MHRHLQDAENPDIADRVSSGRADSSENTALPCVKARLHLYLQSRVPSPQ